MLSRSVSFMSQLVRNSVLFISQICRVPKLLRLNCEESATSSRWVRDTRDDCATILRGILSHKIFEHVQNFCDYFAPLGDICEEITNHWRLFRDGFATQSRCLSPVVAKQSQSSEIGALGLYIQKILTKREMINCQKFNLLLFLELGICSISAILESYNWFRNFYTLKK